MLKQDCKLARSSSQLPSPSGTQTTGMEWALMYQGSRGCVGCGACGWTTSWMMAAYLDLPPVPSPSSLLPSVSISHFYQQQSSLPESRQTKYPANFGPDIKGCHPTPCYLYLGDKESRGWLYFSCPSDLNMDREIHNLKRNVTQSL